MTGSFDRERRPAGGRIVAFGQMLVMAGALSACSSFAEQANPLNWFGDDSPTPAETADGVLPKTTPEGLPGDSGGGHYGAPVRREVTPTRPLVRQAPVSAPSVAAVEPVVASQPAAPAVVSQPAAPAVVAQPAAPAVVAQPAAPAVVAQPAAPAVVTQPAAPAVVAQPSKPAVVSQPAAPVVVAQPAAPAVVSQPATPAAAPQPAPTFAEAQARADQGPAAPPASVDMAPPPPADIPTTVSVPGRPRRLQQQYEQRLAESAQQVVRPAAVTPAASGRVDDTPIHLIDPSSQSRPVVASRGGAGKALLAPPVQPAASFQVAAIDFTAGANLSRTDLGMIADAAKLYRQTPGAVVRVIGHAPSPLVAGGGDPTRQLIDGLAASQARANAVARELNRRGVPAAKILVAADPAAASGGQAGALVFLDVM